MKIEISEVANLPSIFGDFKIKAFKEGQKEHLVIYKDNMDEIPPVRVHS
ncbi:MAG: GTP cyclohydrolase II, partial [Sulfurimonas sp.]